MSERTSTQLAAILFFLLNLALSGLTYKLVQDLTYGLTAVSVFAALATFMLVAVLTGGIVGAIEKRAEARSKPRRTVFYAIIFIGVFIVVGIVIFLYYYLDELTGSS